MTSDAVDAVRSTIPTCWVVAESEARRVSNFKNINCYNSLKIIDISFLLKFETLSLGLINQHGYDAVQQQQALACKCAAVLSKSDQAPILQVL